MTNQLKFAVCALTAILITGCGEATYPVWLPDSSGFLVPRSDGSVVQYDIGKDATRQIIEPGYLYPGRVAISPKGDKFAITTGWIGKNSQTVGIEIGAWPERKRLAVKSQEFGTPSEKVQATYGYCYWRPDGAKILICYASPLERGFVRFATYDVDANEIHAPISSNPAFAICSVIRVSPIAPNGSGYVAAFQDSGKIRFFLVDWEGWEKSISITPEAQRIIDVLLTRPGDEVAKDRLRFPIPNGRWDKNRLICPTREGSLVLDLDKYEISLEPLAKDAQSKLKSLEAMTPSGWRLMQYASFSAGSLDLVCWEKNGPEIVTRLEAIDLAAGTRRTLLEGSPIPLFAARPLTPSPDGKHILAIAVVDGKRNVYVVNSKAEILSTTSLGEREGLERAIPKESSKPE